MMTRHIFYFAWRDQVTGTFSAAVHSLSAGAFPKGTHMPRVDGALSLENAERTLKKNVKTMIGGRGTRLKFESVTLTNRDVELRKNGPNDEPGR